MEDAPSPIIQTPKEEIKESFEIKQDEINYKLNINIINQEIILNILDEKDIMKEYEIKLTFDELKIIHKIFLTISSSQDFIAFIKASIENKKILIKKYKDNQITIELIVEYLFKQNIIKFDLNKKKMNYELCIQDLYQKFDIINKECKNVKINYIKITEENRDIKEENNKIKEDIKILKEENNKIKEDIKKLKEDNKILKQGNIKLSDEKLKSEEKIKILENEKKNLVNRINNLEIKNNTFNKNLISVKKNNISISIDSTIIEKNYEFDMIYSAIKGRMNKELKEIKKLYQATKDGGDPKTFHKLCDGIPNTLVLYKSDGNRRFGGYASQCWKSKGNSIEDNNCFLFSLDKKKIHYPEKSNFRISNHYYNGPSFLFRGGYIIEIENALIDKVLKTCEKKYKDIFGGDEHAFSEDGNYEGVYAKEYEVFQIIFE